MASKSYYQDHSTLCLRSIDYKIIEKDYKSIANHIYFPTYYLLRVTVFQFNSTFIYKIAFSYFYY